MHTRRYSAFISYRHADNTQEGRRWAEWLHRALERYVVPPDLIGTPNLRGEPVRDSLYPIFRDEDELPANAATCATLASSASAPAFTVSPSASIPANSRPNRIVTPDNPPSRMIVFDKAPNTCTGISFGQAFKKS